MLKDVDITVFERANRPMAKLAITGGGRCNLTNTFEDIGQMKEAYPRGFRLMERLFREFGPRETMRWWEKEGVKLTVQEDSCVFPCSQDAMEIVGTLARLMREGGIEVRTRCKIDTLPEDYDRIVVTTGGSPRKAGISFLEPLELKVVEPVPSLFALNIEDKGLHELSGTVVEDVKIGIAGSKFEGRGILLITHFGMSGPAVLRLSSYAARHLAEQGYKATLNVNWMRGANEEEVRERLRQYAREGKMVTNEHPRHLTARHWQYLLHRAGIAESQRWNALNQKEMNRLTSVLTADTYPMTGRCAHKAEFVTCGGIALSEIDSKTLALKRFPNIYAAGEVLDIDAITGGFNLQAAWTTGYIVAKNISQQ